ncbi:MAG TPA: hypothetical protein VGW74_15160, partial [Propionibacteriaceae bacterium]|nr:hypothetical protein [Propionibacteriaceae bacterium]
MAADEAVLACPACGQQQPFTRLPLFALTGPSGAGKSAIGTALAGRLWLRLVAALHQNGRPVLL